MRVSDLLAPGEPVFSFEFFPPKTAEGLEALFSAIGTLQTLSPGYVSVTYGAGGSTRDLTLDLVSRIKCETSIEAVAHLSCVGSTRKELRELLDRFAHAGIRNLFALRGDPPQGARSFEPPPGGLRYASELVALAREDGRFCIGAACYPEGHVEAPDLASDLAHLKLKVDAGTDFLVTQLFFSNTAYFDFVARARTVGIAVPIIPGIMPITNVDQIERFTSMCGASIPAELAGRLDELRNDPQAVMDFGVAYSTAQCADLLARGAPGLHFYTLNRSPATRAILSALQILQPWRRAGRAG